MADVLHGYIDEHAVSTEKSYDVAILVTAGAALVGLCLAVGVYAAGHTIDSTDLQLTIPII